MADKTCGHEGCDCAPREDGYCSDYCKQHASDEGHEQHECACGHPECHLPSAA